MMKAAPRGMSVKWLENWQALLEGPLEPILDALTGSTVNHDEMRQHSPLTAVLSPQQRQAVLDTFSQRRSGQSPHAALAATSPTDEP